MLYVCYPYLDVIPESAVEFYKKLYLTLYSRHDKIKNFNRDKYTSISAYNANYIFDALCFNSLNKGDLEFNDASLTKHISDALRLNSIDIDENENVKKDIINVTCLIQKDGYDKYVYLHKSIQEFHAAQFISNLPHEHKNKFYRKLSEIIEREDKFDNVIFFLKEIDTKDYESLLIMNTLEKYNFQHLSTSNQEQIVTSFIDHALSKAQISFTKSAIDNEEYARISGYSSISYGTVFSVMNMFLGNHRFTNNPVEQALSDSMRNIRKRSKANIGFETISPEQLESMNAEKTTRDFDGESIVLYTIPMDVYLENMGELGILKRKIESFTLDFYTNRYLPVSKKLLEVSSILDIDFNM
ncbi:hypothetical protein AB4168_23040 [Vibrio splendidus]